MKRILSWLLMAALLLVPVSGMAQSEAAGITGAEFLALLPALPDEETISLLLGAQSVNGALAVRAVCAICDVNSAALRESALLAQGIELGLLDGVALSWGAPIDRDMASALAENAKAYLDQRAQEERVEREIWATSTSSPIKMRRVHGFNGTTRMVPERAAGMPNPAATSEEASYAAVNDSLEWDYNDMNDEGYALRVESGFRNPADDPFSTFSLDVDTASYANVRRMLLQGKLPDAGAVRPEEFLNYFRYTLDAPKAGEPLGVTLMAGACPWNPQNKLVLVGLQSALADEGGMPAQNLVFLMDVSGSMRQSNRLPLAQKAMKLLVNGLNARDKVALVTYAGSVGTALESTSCDQKEKIFEAIDALTAGGSTNGEGGIEAAYRLAGEHFIQGGNNRVILLSDGDFNVGAHSPNALKELIEEKRAGGIFLSVLGFGMGNYKDATMETLADAGNGNYAYIDTLKEAKKVLADDMTGTLLTVAKDVKLQVEWNPATVKNYRLIGYENRQLQTQDFTDDKKDAGEMGANRQMIALYEVVLNEEGVPSGTASRYTVTTTTGLKELMQVSVRYKLPDAQESVALEPATLRSNDVRSDSDTFRFAAAVAEFAMLLSKSEHTKEGSYAHVSETARAALGDDAFGYRAELVQLSELAELIQLIG